jgi:hypothetical protein
MHRYVLCEQRRLLQWLSLFSFVLKFSLLLVDKGMTPRSSIFAYLVPAKEEARSKVTRSPQGPALRLGVEGKKYL